YFIRNSMPSSVWFLLMAAISGQSFSSLMVMIPLIEIPREVHRSVKCLNSLQLALLRPQLYYKLKLMTFHESLLTDKKINLTVGPLAPITSRTILEVNIALTCMS